MTKGASYESHDSWHQQPATDVAANNDEWYSHDRWHGQAATDGAGNNEGAGHDTDSRDAHGVHRDGHASIAEDAAEWSTNDLWKAYTEDAYMTDNNWRAGYTAAAGAWPAEVSHEAPPGSEDAKRQEAVGTELPIGAAAAAVKEQPESPAKAVSLEAVWFQGMPNEDQETLLKFMSDQAPQFGTKQYDKVMEKLRDSWGITEQQLQHVELQVGVKREVGDSIKRQLSMTHAAKYMRFLRQGRSAKRQVGPSCALKFTQNESNRLELFTMWCQSNEDWGECEIIESRIRESSKEAEVVYAWLNTYDLLGLYRDDAEMVEKVKAACRGCVPEGRLAGFFFVTTWL